MPSFDYLAGNAPQAASYKAPDMAAQLYQMLGSLPQDTFNAQQNARTTKMQQPILGPDGQPTMDLNALIQGLAQVGGAQTQQQMLPQILGAQADAGIANRIANPDSGESWGATQPPQEDRPTAPNGQPPEAFHAAKARQDASQGKGVTQTQGGETVNSLAGDHDIDLDAFLKANPGAKGLLNRDLTPSQAKAVGDRMVAFKDGTPPSTGQPATAMRKSPLGTAEDSAKDRAQANAIRAAATRMGANQNAVQSALAAAKALDDRAEKRDADIAKINAPTTEQQNVESGATQAAGRIAADTKYYDTLHKGIVGSATMAAAQKQNIDALRQIADQPGFTPGFGSDTILKFQRMAAQLGIRTQSAAPRELFDQISAKILANQFDAMKSMSSELGESAARIFKPMLDIEEEANITHADTIEGVRTKINMLDKSGDLLMKWADKADDYVVKHGALDAGFNKELRSEVAKARLGDLFPKEEAKPPPVAGARQANDGKWYVPNPDKPGKYREVIP